MAEAPATSGPDRPGGDRLQGLDAVKGLCILGVVLIHAAPGVDDAYGNHVIGGLTRLAVPLFLAITGYLTALRGMGRDRMRRNLVVFIRLHLIYGAFYGVVTALLLGLPDPVTAKFVVMRFAEAAYPGQYYLVILIQLFLFASLLPEPRACRSAAWVVGSAAAGVAGVALVLAIPTLGARLGLPAPLVKAATTPNVLWLWYFYFALGAFLGAAAGEAASRRPPWILAAFGIGIATLSWPDVPDWPNKLLYPYARLPIAVGSTLVILALPRLAALRSPAWLTRLGRDSFGIFVLHPAVLMAFEAALGPPTSVPSSWLRVTVTVALCTALTALLRRRARWALP